jgi:hypothetical protein
MYTTKTNGSHPSTLLGEIEKRKKPQLQPLVFNFSLPQFLYPLKLK